MPGPAMHSGDWAYGCDNSRACLVTSLGGTVEGEFSTGLRVSLRFPAKPGEITATLAVLASPADDMGGEEAAVRPSLVAGFRIDGRRIRLEDIDEEAGTHHPAVRYKVSRTALNQLATGNRLDLLDRAGRPIARISLRGMAAALRHVHKVRAEGPLPVSPLPPVAHVLPPPMLAGASPQFPASQAVRWQEWARCPELDRALAERPLVLRSEPIDERHDLILISCAGSQTDDADSPVWFLPLVRSHDEAKLYPARFDLSPGASGIAGPTLIADAWLSGDDGILRIQELLRSAGDCGALREYVWDRPAGRFVLIRLTAMPSCRSAGEWITIYSRPRRLER